MVSGLTIVRNGMQAGYPLVESILSGLSLCDEFVVMDDSTDETPEVLERMRRRYGKIRVISRPWPLHERAACLATVTNWGMAECRYPWLLYLQADEVLHESVLPRLAEIIATEEAPAVVLHRLQLCLNFQEAMGEIKNSGGKPLPWPECIPDGHWVTRLGLRSHLRSEGDALSFAVKDDRYLTLDPDPKKFQLFDITRCFMGNFPGKSLGQSQIWNDAPNQNAAGWMGLTPGQWAEQVATWEREGFPAWATQRVSRYKHLLPASMRRWVGETHYQALSELVDA